MQMQFISRKAETEILKHFLTSYLKSFRLHSLDLSFKHRQEQIRYLRPVCNKSDHVC